MNDNLIIMKCLGIILSQNNNFKISKNLLFNEINSLANEIFSNEKTRNGRSFEKIFEDCEKIAIEYAICIILRSSRNIEKFNFKDKNTYNFDILFENKKIEVKHQIKNNKYFSYDPNKIYTYINHSKDLDYVITASLEKDTENYIISFKMIFDSKTFNNYNKKSKFNSNNYYDHIESIKHNNCFMIK